MWNRVFSTFFVLLGLVVTVSAQEPFRTSVLSSVISGTSATPKIISNDPARYWVAVWRQDDAIVSRIVRKDGTIATVRQLVTGLSPFTRGFDLIYVRNVGTYLLAYEASDGLRIQTFNKNFGKTGVSVKIQQGVQNTKPQLLVDEPSKRIFLFWFTGSGSRFLKRVELNSDGRNIGAITNTAIAGQGSSFEAFSVSENPQNEIQFAAVSQRHPGTGVKILGISIRTDGTLVRNEPSTIHQLQSDAEVRTSTSFAASGNGIVLWRSGAQISHRSLTAEGAPSGAINSIQNGADINSNPSVVFDSKKELFVQAWTKGDSILASTIDPVHASSEDDYHEIASSSGSAINTHSSFDRATGRIVTVWEEHSGNTYKVHATVFTVAVEEFDVEGVVALRKDYKPPFVLKGKTYLNKFHVKSNGKLYRAYITPESEVIGELPKAGDRILMEYEPFRKRYRGYVESIQVVRQ